MIRVQVIRDGCYHRSHSYSRGRIHGTILRTTSITEMVLAWSRMRIQFDHVRMSVTSDCEVLFICVCVLIFCSQSLSFENVECKKINGCKCVLPDGIHIDMTRLNDGAKWYVSWLQPIGLRISQSVAYFTARKWPCINVMNFITICFSVRNCAPIAIYTVLANLLATYGAGEVLPAGCRNNTIFLVNYLTVIN